MDTKRFNAEHAAKSRAVCERIEREDAERRSKLGERERAILDMWPRFEDGECVWFGDEVEMQDEIVREVWTFTLDVNAEGDRRLYLNGFNGLFMLPGEPVKRPAPADSWERLEEDAAKGVCEYAEAERKPGTINAHTCCGCRFDEGGDGPTCEKQMTLDLIRRAKALAGVEVE